MSKNEKRMAGEYEVIQSIEIGPREIIVCENKEKSPRYVCSFVEYFGVLELYPDEKVSDDYIEIMKDFVGRISHEIEELEKTSRRK